MSRWRVEDWHTEPDSCAAYLWIATFCLLMTILLFAIGVIDAI